MIPLLILWAQTLDPTPYSRGLEAARTGNLPQAQAAFLAGMRQSPADKRYPLELAGLAFRQNDRTLARHYLHIALRIDPADQYANDFLGTLYFLDSNYEAAIRFWNRAGKPRIASIDTAPAPPPVRSVLLDRALAFAPGEVMREDQYLATVAWLRATEAFGNFRLELAARPEEKFDAVVRWTPANRFYEAASGLRGVFLQTVEYEAHNLGHGAITAGGLYRWDAQKRRAFAQFAAPLENNPGTRYRLWADVRSETWNIGAPTDFRLRKAETGASLRLMPTGRFSWELGGRLADRRYQGLQPFASGFTLVSNVKGTYRVLSLLERGITVDATATLDLGRFFSDRGGIYGRGQTGVAARWKPLKHAIWESAAAINFGAIRGGAPYDELFMAGREGSGQITLRGHAGVHEGKKGVAPVAGQYVMANFDVFREVWKSSFVSTDLGPLLDIGHMGHQATGATPGSLLIDVGAQVRLRMPTGFSVILSFAIPARGGSGAFDAMMR